MKLTPDEIETILGRPAIRARNPELAGGRPPLARLPVAQPQHLPAPALVRTGTGTQARPEGAATGPRWRVTLLSCRRRLLDLDNLVGGLKPIRDEVARWLGEDDSEKVISWTYEQLKTQHACGTIVLVERPPQ